MRKILMETKYFPIILFYPYVSTHSTSIINFLWNYVVDKCAASYVLEMKKKRKIKITSEGCCCCAK